MRVTQSMLSNRMINNLSGSYEKLAKLQEQLYSEKKYTKPSDDPAAAMMGMGYRTDLSKISQYTSNINEAENWLDSTDSTITQAISALQRFRELTVNASSDTLGDDERKNIAEELEQLKGQLADLGDTQIGGRYIFSGLNTNVKPSENAYGSEPLKVDVFEGISIQINTDGTKMFGETLSADGSIAKTIEAVKNGDRNIDEMLDGIDKTINLFLSTQAEVGARTNRLDLMSERLGDQKQFATEILSKNEDIDIEQAILDLTTQETIHNAALSVGAKIMQPSLLDFLR